MSEHQQTQQSKKSESSSQRRKTLSSQIFVSNPVAIIQRARINPKSLTSADVLQLQRTIGNRAVGRLLSEITNASKVQQLPIQRQEIPEEEEPLQGMFENKSKEAACPSCSIDVLQKQDLEEEEKPLQGKMIDIIQLQEMPEEEEPLQGVLEKKLEQSISSSCSTAYIQRKEENCTGMPDDLKAGVENLSGINMSDVRVHYNSSKPAEIGALAYTQGAEIHVAPGQEKHLPHEAWHVVQQAQGRVRPTFHMKDVAVNDDTGLEQEADKMGLKALQKKSEMHKVKFNPVERSNNIIQRAIGFEFEVSALRTSRPKHFYNTISSAEHDENKREPLQKGDVILSGDGFEMQADELTGGVSDVEFVTHPFDENTGGGALHNTMTRISGLVNEIANKLQAHHNLIRAGSLAEFGTIKKKRVLITQWGQIRAKPQTTVGLRLDQLFTLMKEIGVAQHGEALEDTNNRLLGRQQLMSLPTAPPHFGGAIVPGPAISRVGNATTDIINGINAYKATDHYLQANWTPSNEIKGLLALLTVYLRSADIPLPNYAKAIAPIMARTDFSQLFHMLPQPEQDYFKHNNGENWISLIRQIPTLNGLDMDLPVFSQGIHRGDNVNNPNNHELDALTRNLWLRSITQGTDLMTKRNFPMSQHRDELESLGALGNKTETVGAGDVEGAIFELRGMAGGIPPNDWEPLTQRVLQYINRKNHLDPHAYGH